MSNIIENIYEKYAYIRWGEKEKSFGKLNPDKRFYVIRPRHKTIEGLGSLIMEALKHIDYALENDYIPYIDYTNFMQGEIKYDKDQNVWEKFFNQPTNISRNEIWKSKNVIISGYRKKDIKLMHFPDRGFTREDNIALFEDVIKNRISIKDNINDKINKEAELLDISNCLGIFVRGTDFAALHPSGHHIQPSQQQLEDAIDLFLQKHSQCKMFLVTEDAKIYRKIKEKYPWCQVASFDRFIENYAGKDYLVYDKKGEGNSDEEYFIKMMLLARCKYFLGSLASGSNVARAFNGGKYEDELILDYGNY